ncbi:long-chain-fatty-acid--CoA ligase [Aromatoleum petrolei]|uniref:Long-chain-fatty-acid--CoA ligase n=2 Tax=Aromatoleum petrolei TaxID=76116 RepID=A0ABX1MPI2_9RHOO|nr:long-chain-fatty-acid--CoA ligase [Aromatoleum petrolei]NMF88558.1 long-chain-fatty-acid--CoA ligase [Aromatoleum petrolei]
MRDLVERNERYHGDQDYLIFGERRLSFRQYTHRVRRLAGALVAGGLRHQDRIGILAMNCPEYLEVYGVAEVSGLVASPVNFRLAGPEIAYIIRDASPRVLFFESQYAAVIDRLRGELTCVERYICIGDEVPQWAEAYEDVLAKGDESGPAMAPGPDDLLCIMYTSGTTGRPKGAMITHRAFVSLCEAWAQEMSADVGDKVLLAMPLFHIGARSQGGAITARGGAIVLHRAFEPEAILRTIAEQRITQVHLAPTMMQAVLNVPGQDKYDASSLKTINYAAAPMPVTVLRQALERFGPILINGYGQTEGSGTVLAKHYHRPHGDERDRRRLGSIGQPQPATLLRIVDENDMEVPAGAIGEICLKSAQNMIGYWNNSVATVEALRGGWLHTGDMGYQDEDGFVYLADRKKDVIISGGENIYSREVEEALMSHEAVMDAAVIGVPDPYWGESVNAVVVLRAGARLAPSDLVAHCKRVIASYKCPKSVEFVDELPRLPSGKISKVTLRERFRALVPAK